MFKEEVFSDLINRIIIGVIVLGVIILVVFMIKPAKIMAKNRDSLRLVALTNLETSLNLYLADDKNFDSLTTGKVFDSRVVPYEVKGGNISIGGTGWLPLNFSSVTGGVPINELPLDPLNNDDYYYQVGVNVANKTYEINCRFEDSTMTKKYESDGGNSGDWYEIGPDLGILE